MLKNIASSFLLVVLLAMSGFAQQPCGLDEMAKSWVAEQPERADELREYEAAVPALAGAAAVRATTIIPVVVHVIHKGESIGSGTNVSNSRINSQLEILNADFQRLNADANETPSQFTGVAADAGIQFCLVNVDPNGNPTTGITRQAYANIPDEDFIENTIKNNTSWDPDRYLNVWVVDIPNPSFLGYSYLPTPTMVGSVRDGLVVDYLRFGQISSSNRGRTATHELGHYLGLRHMWGNNDNNGNPIGCGSDDGVDDTPNSDSPYFNCPNSGSSCGSSDMFMNYMDYTDDDCMNLFTQGQANLMQSTLSGIRSQLVSGSLTPCTLDCKDLSAQDIDHGFETSEANTEWTSVNANGDDRTWVIVEDSNVDWGPNQGSGMAVYFWSTTNTADDYLFSPCIALEKDHKYEITFSYACAQDVNSLYPEKFEVGLSANQSGSDFSVPNNDWVFNPIMNAYPDYQDATLTFIANNNESKSIGFHIFSDADQYALQIDDVQIVDLGTAAGLDTADADPEPSFPNPTFDEIYVNRPSNMGDVSTVSLIATDGRLLRTWNPAATESRLTLSLGELPAGVYLLKWSDGMHHWTDSIVKLTDR